MTGYEQDLIRVAASQYGLLERTQALELGMTARMIQTNLDRGWWSNPHPGVYVVGGAPETRHRDVLAACMASGPEATASHRAAAWVWRSEGFTASTPVEIVVPEGRGPRAKGVILHRTRRLDPVDRTVWQGIPVTTRERTLIDLGAVVRPWMVETALNHYLRTGGTLRKLELRLDAIGGRGCRGAGVLRELLTRPEGGRPLGSALEVLYRRLVVDAGMWPGVAQYEVTLRDGRRIFIGFRQATSTCLNWPDGRVAGSRRLEANVGSDFPNGRGDLTNSCAVAPGRKIS